jgi:RNA polymerase-binding transcription factor DksA
MESTEHYKTQLEAERIRLQTDLHTIATLDEATGDWVALPVTEELTEADENVEADGVESWNERRATVSQLETSYKNIVRALDKIAAGTYGMCEISGEPIEADRLAANPSARTCKLHRDNERELSL